MLCSQTQDERASQSRVEEKYQMLNWWASANGRTQIFRERAKCGVLRGVAMGGSGGWTNPPRAGKGRQKSGFFFFFLSGIAQASVFVEKDERTPPTENKSCKTTRSNGTSPKRRRRQRKPAVGLRARRGVARCECQTPSYRSVYSRTENIHGERPAAQTDKRTAQMPSCSVESCWNYYGSETAARTRERKKLKAEKGSYALSGFGFSPKKRSWSDGDLNATATSQRQLVEEDSSSQSSRQLQEQDEGSSFQSSSATRMSVKL